MDEAIEQKHVKQSTKDNSSYKKSPMHEAIEKRQSKKQNPWIISTVILSIAVIALLIFSFVRTGTGKNVSATTAGKNLADFAQRNGLLFYVNNVVDNGSFYQVYGSINGSAQVVPVTKDGLYLINGLISLTGTATGTQNSAPNQAAPSKPVNIPLDNSPSIGNANAKVTVIEFSDFSCPYCEAASGYNDQMVSAMQSQGGADWQPIVTNLLKDYVDTGKVFFVSKYSFGHTGGHPASLVGWCLNDQSSALFWKFYAAAYSHQSADTENLDLMKTVASGFGADMTKLQTCLDSGKYNSTFDVEQNEAISAGVQGTPAFVVNGQLIEGAVPYSQVKNVIDSDLAK